MTQVVIVGAGPTGATLALLLVKRGIVVKLIESSRNFRRVCPRQSRARLANYYLANYYIEF